MLFVYTCKRRAAIWKVHERSSSRTWFAVGETGPGSTRRQTRLQCTISLRNRRTWANPALHGSGLDRHGRPVELFVRRVGMPRVISLILGGGRGTRLFPLTKSRSKPAVPIAGKYRLIDIPVSNCIHCGIDPDLRTDPVQFRQPPPAHLQYVQVRSVQRRLRRDLGGPADDGARIMVSGNGRCRAPQYSVLYREQLRPGVDPFGRPALPDGFSGHDSYASRKQGGRDHRGLAGGRTRGHGVRHHENPGGRPCPRLRGEAKDA